MGYRILSSGSEKNMLIICRKTIRRFIGAMKSEALCRSTLGIHGIDIKIPKSVGGKRYFLTVSTPNNFIIMGFMKGQLTCGSTGNWHTIEVPLVGKSNGLTIWRDRRVTHPFWAYLSHAVKGKNEGGQD